MPYLSGSSTNAPVTVGIDNLTVQAVQWPGAQPMDSTVTTDRASVGRPGRAVAGGRRRWSRLGARPAVPGGIAAQLSQALGSLVLQVIAAQLLGADALGAFAVLYGVIIMATGVCTGFVGDSLTVLDRGRRDVRAALQNWLLVLSAAGAAVGYLIAVLGGFLSPGAALLFAGGLRRCSSLRTRCAAC